MAFDFQTFVKLSRSSTSKIDLNPDEKSLLVEPGQNFSFTAAFPPNVAFSFMYNEAIKPAVTQTLKGNNACVLAIGTGQNVKNQALFSSQGLLHVALEQLLSAGPVKATLSDIYLETIQDGFKRPASQPSVSIRPTFGMGKLLLLSETVSRVDVQDSPAGGAQLLGLDEVLIKSPQDLIEKLNNYWVDVERDSVSDDSRISGPVSFPQKQSLVLILTAETGGKLAFVSLADSQFFYQRSKKSAPAAHKAQVRGIAIQQSFSFSKALTTLAAVLRALQSRERADPGSESGSTEFIAPYRDSKLTHALETVLTPSKARYASLLAFVDCKSSDTSHVVSCLQFVERCKADWNKVSPSTQFSSLANVGLQEKAIQKLTKENNDQRAQIQALKFQHKHELETLKDKLGITIDIESILKSKMGHKERNYLKQHKEAVERADTLSRQNQDLSKKVDILSNEVEELKREKIGVQEEYSRKFIVLKENYNKVKQEREVGEMKMENLVKESVKERNDELRQMLTHSHALIQEKASLIHHLRGQLARATESHQKLNEMKDVGKREAEMTYHKNLKGQAKEREIQIEKLKEVYESQLKAKQKEMEDLDAAFKEKYLQKKKEVQEVKDELVGVFMVVQKQAKIIDNIENGRYSGGIKQCNIPGHEKPSYPVRQNYPILYSALLSSKTLASFKTPTRAHQMYKVEAERNLAEKMTTSRSEALMPGMKEQEKSFTDRKATPVDQLQFYRTSLSNINLEVNIARLTDNDLREYAVSLQDQMRKLQKRANSKDNGIAVETVHNIMNELQRFKTLYHNEIKKRNDAKVVLESQKRMIERLQLEKAHSRTALSPSSASHKTFTAMGRSASQKPGAKAFGLPLLKRKL